MNCAARPNIISDVSKGILDMSKRNWRRECHNKSCNIMDFYFDENGELKDFQNYLSDCIVKDKPCLNLKKSCYKWGLATYDDVTNVSIRVLKKYPNIAKLICKRFPYIIIDEAQDTSQEQMKIIDLLILNGLNDIILIGDPDQSIYEWRNADPQVFISKYNDPNWVSLTINENFRSSQKICNATKIFSTLDYASTAIGDDANVEYKPKIIKYDSNNPKEAVEYFLNDCIENNIVIAKDKIAVLTRGRKGISSSDYYSITDLWQNELTELLAVATYYKIIGNNKKHYDLIEKALYYLVIDTEFSLGIDMEKIVQVISYNEWKKIVFNIMVNMPGKGVILREWEIEIKTVLEECIIKYNLTLRNEIIIKTKTRVMDKTIKDFKEHTIDDFFQSQNSEQYTQSAIHAVKGCTFEAVLLIINQRGKLTSNILNTYDAVSEEIRTAYVAMTRAKKILMIAIPKSIQNSTLIRFPNSEWDYIDL